MHVRGPIYAEWQLIKGGGSFNCACVYNYIFFEHAHVDYERLVNECEKSAATRPKGHYITNACVRKDRKTDFCVHLMNYCILNVPCSCGEKP